MGEHNGYSLDALKGLFAASPCGAAIAAAGTAPLYVNAALCGLFGYDERELCERLGSDAGGLIYQADQSELENFKKEFHAAGTVQEHEFRIIRRDGAIRWLKLSGTPVTVDGRVCALCFFTDITPGKEAELPPARSNYYRGLLDASLDAGTVITRTDLGRPLVYSSENFSAMLGYTPEEAGRFYLDAYRQIIHPDDYERVMALDRKYYAEQAAAYSMEFRLVKKDGSIFWAAEKATRITLSDGGAAYLCVFVNITESKNRESELANAQELLRLQKKLTDAAVDQISLGYYEYDITTHTAIIPPLTQKMYAVPARIEHFPESFLATSMIHPGDKEAHRAAFARIGKGSDREQFIARTMTAGGALAWLRYTITAIKDAGGQPLEALVTMEDVSSEQEAIELYRRRLGESVKISALNLWAWERVNLSRNMIESFTSVMDDTTKLDPPLDYERTAAWALPWVTPESSRRQVADMTDRQTLIQAFRDGTTTLSTVYQRQKAGERFYWLEMTVNLLSDPASHDIIAVFVWYDVTREKVTELAMSAIGSSKYSLIGMINPSSGSVFIIYNEWADKLPELYHDSYDAMAESFFDLIQDRGTPTAEAEQQEPLRSSRLEAICSALKKTEVYSFTSSYGQEHRRYLLNEYRYADTDRSQILATVSDVTELLQNERRRHEQLKSALDAARKADAAKSEFLSRMSHDVRTPMNAIMNLIGMAKDELGDRDALLADIVKTEAAGRHLMSLLDDILEMARIESGRLELRPSAYPFGEFSAYINAVFFPMCQKKGIDFVQEYGDIRETLFVDRLRLNQLLYNLLSNSVRFTPAGGRICFSVRGRHSRSGFVEIVFTVADTGIGMSPEFQKKLFQPFEREDTVSAYAGTGLGLAISKAIVDAMGGTIAVKSEKGRGTEFAVTLELPVAAGQQAEARRQPSSGGDVDTLRGRRVLVCEDNRINAMILTRLLDKAGVVSDSAGDGESGVELFCGSASGCYDAILMDIRMPVMDGLEAARYIRGADRPDAKSVPIIAVSANAFDADAAESLAAGMDAHLTKPVEPESLYKTLAELIRARKG